MDGTTHGHVLHRHRRSVTFSSDPYGLTQCAFVFHIQLGLRSYPHTTEDAIIQGRGIAVAHITTI